MNKFILGFIAGEGSFHVTLATSGSGYVVPKPTFSIRVYENEIIDAIHQEVSIGNVRKRADGKVWRVQSISECEDIVQRIEESAGPLFKKTDKWRQFKLWSEAVEIKQKDGRTSKEDKKRLVEISYSIPKSNTKTKDMNEWFSLIEGE